MSPAATALAPGAVLLRKPGLQHLPGFIDALAHGFTPDNLRGRAAAAAELEQIAADPHDFVARQDDPQAAGPPIRLPDGRQVPRLPGFRAWIWLNADAHQPAPPWPPADPLLADAAAQAHAAAAAALAPAGMAAPAPGRLAGVISLRWQPGTAELPPHVLGHCGYAVVPWLRNRGLASAALRAVLAEAAALGLPWIELTCDADNHASRKVMQRCGARLIGEFTKDAVWGGTPSLRYRIDCG